MWHWNLTSYALAKCGLWPNIHFHHNCVNHFQFKFINIRGEEKRNTKIDGHAKMVCHSANGTFFGFNEMRTILQFHKAMDKRGKSLFIRILKWCSLFANEKLPLNNIWRDSFIFFPFLFCPVYLIISATKAGRILNKSSQILNRNGTATTATK